MRAGREGTIEVLGKAAQLRSMVDVAEAYLSLWCRSPRMAEMYAVVPEAYERTLAEGRKLKLRALWRLAFGDDASRFQAAVMFHDAVRTVQRP